MSGNFQSNLQARRNLLKLGTCGAMTNATFLSTLMHLKMTNAIMAMPVITPPSDYKALVCLFFNGAIDSFNVLTPYGTTQADANYLTYRQSRTSAAFRRSTFDDSALVNGASAVDPAAGPAASLYGSLLPIVSNEPGGAKTYGIHPKFSKLRGIYNNGDATFVANVGALVEPILNYTQYYQTSPNVKVKPIGLFSHPDQQRHWQTAVPTSRNQVTGWGGKMLDLFSDPLVASASNVYTAISTAGQSILLTGEQINAYSISNVSSATASSGGAVKLGGYPVTLPTTGTSNSSTVDGIYTSVQNDFASQTYADILERTIRDNRKGSRDAADLFQTAYTAAVPGNITAFSVGGSGATYSGIGAAFASVAKTIKMTVVANAGASSPLQQKRQIFLVQLGGWDHHASLVANQNNMIPAVDDALSAFYDFLVTETLLDKVTTFSISDFSRTLSYNGSGTDHAWGANAIVMGGAVNASVGNNRIWGTYPNLALTSPSGSGIDLGRGVLIPQTSSDVYHGEICRWFGVGNNDTELKAVLPNIRNFYSSGAASPFPFLNAP